jgi:protocatechuate 3,4-dioxygenase beta subunit
VYVAGDGWYEEAMNRRMLFRRSAVAGSALALMPLSKAIAETPAQPEGPFHPVNLDTDLLQKGPGAPLAAGRVTHVKGNVKDEQGNNVPGVFVELWQADENGKYAHPSDPLVQTPDANFQFWGRAQTGGNGNFAFRTIKPGAYPADENWMRPPHLHFRFYRLGFHELTTQMYFAGEALNADDLILQSLPAAQQKLVVVPFAAIATETKAGVKDLSGFFQVEIKKVV